jgi:UDP-GlcNAc:undecaprenyl-phosphate/decaprenyl-phosphate GlcNAc-1-phosphate transferase
VQVFGLDPIELGWFGIPFTMFFMLGAINSLNLIDGMDGLLGSVGVILSLALAAMALLLGAAHIWAVVVALALAGALIGFLRHNLPPANVFMGDAGSMLVGLILGALAIHCSLKAPATIALALPVSLLVLPIFDTTAAIVRRKLTGRSIYTTDRGHLHHCLQRSGLSTRRSLAVVAVFCIVACTGVLTSQAFGNDWIALITAASIVGVLVMTRRFGFAEFMLIKGRLMCMLAPGHHSSQLEVRLQGTAAWKDLWHALLLRASGLNLRQVLLDVNAPSLHEGYHARWDGVAEANEERPLWHVEIPMTASGVSVGRLVLSGLPDDQPMWKKIAILMEVVEEFNAPVGQTFLSGSTDTNVCATPLTEAITADAPAWVAEPDASAPEIKQSSESQSAANPPHVGLEVETLKS